MTGYFLCEVVQGAPQNCLAIPAERTMQISEMITIISVLWAAIGVAGRGRNGSGGGEGRPGRCQRREPGICGGDCRVGRFLRRQAHSQGAMRKAGATPLF